jgi:hypothetical protein
MLRAYRSAIGGLLLTLCAFCSTACTIGRVNQRVDYWSKTVAERLPPGSTLQDAKDLFSRAGLKFVCCVSAEPSLKRSWYATERDVGRLLWMRYSVAVLVEVAPDDRVAHVEVERWGLGP